MPMSKLLRWLFQRVNVAIYVWSATGENDPDLVSATESLITKFTEE